MTRIAAVVFTAVLAIGCNKPSEDSCRKAIKNMRTLMGTDSPTSTADINGDVRRCKGSSKKKAVECAGNAKTLEELHACDFMNHKKGSGAPTPEPGAAGSAPAGSAPAAGSATP